MPTTIREIAKLADVSSGTVSRVLNNDPTLSVTEKNTGTRKKKSPMTWHTIILQAAKRKIRL
ncbi:hypothetical protein OAL24_00918 [Oenococcus sicerae]|nr:hypothetical protein OAL24_00918 [Oenococcus sicerae]